MLAPGACCPPGGLAAPLGLARLRGSWPVGTGRSAGLAEDRTAWCWGLAARARWTIRGGGDRIEECLPVRHQKLQPLSKHAAAQWSCFTVADACSLLLSLSSGLIAGFLREAIYLLRSSFLARGWSFTGFALS